MHPPSQDQDTARRWLIAPAGGGAPRVGARLVSAALTALFLAALFTFTFHQLRYHWDWLSVYKYRRNFLSGFEVTILISLASLLLSVLFGLALALLRRGRVLPLRYLARTIIETIRGAPLLVQILIFYYVVADAIGMENRYVAGVLTLALFHGAYISEIIRGGIEAISRSQLDSARALGMAPPQIYRWVIFPQAVRQMLPALAGQLASLVKDSSLLSIIGISELTLQARAVNSYTVSAFESYLPLAVGYLLLTLPISLWTQAMERRAQYET